MFYFLLCVYVNRFKKYAKQISEKNQYQNKTVIVEL